MATIINHTNCAGLTRSLDKIPSYWIQKAKKDLHIAYGTASHGLQVHYGCVCLNTWDGTGLYTFNHGGTSGALDWRTWTGAPYFGGLNIAISLDLDANTSSNRTAWETATRTYLDANPDINVIMWAWCTGLISATQANVDLYISLMEGLETDYPGVKFVYMTAHVNGAVNEPTNTNNAYIRAYCNANNKILYDFADIESYNPDGDYFLDLHATANCDYDGGGNWALEWQAAHTEGVDWFSCYSPCVSCHSQDLNCNLKAVAFWQLAARLAGWDGMSATEYELPGDRTIPWRPGIYTGDVHTGIPTVPNSIIMQTGNPAGAYYVDPTGVTDATTSINTALTACPSNGAVLLPPGTFRVNTTGAVISASHSGVVLRGSGAGSTKLMGYSQTGNCLNFTGSGLDNGVSITSGYNKGSVTLVLASLPSGLAVGSYGMVYQTNNTTLMGGPTTYMLNAISQIVKVSAINGTTITLDRELYYTYDVNYTPTFARMVMLESVGIEDLTMDLNNAMGGGLRWSSVAGGWLKNCEITGSGGWHIRFVQCARCEIVKNYVHHGRGFASDQAYGIGLYGRDTDNLIEDNRCYYLRHGIVLEYGGTGNVIAYNYSDINYDENIPNSTGMQSIHTHGGFQYQNLFEGNITSQMNFDAYLAQPATRKNTLLRNHSRGYDRPGAGRRFCLEVACHSLEENIIGNIWGRPGDYGIGDYEQVVGDVTDEAVYRLGWWGSIYSGYAFDGVTPLPDVRVNNTIIRHGNYDYMTNLTRYVSGEITTIPNSWYLSSKPSWFGFLDWPAIGPDVAGYTKDIPSKWRWDQYTNPSGPWYNNLSIMFTDEIGEITGFSNTQTAKITIGTGEQAKLYVDTAKKAVVSGSDAVYTVHAYPYGGFTGNITLDISGLPANATDSYSVNPITETGTSVVTVTTTGVAVGSHKMTITGTSAGGTVASVRLILDIVESADADIKVPFRHVRAKKGDNAVFTIEADPIGGYTGDIDLSVSGVPSGATSAFGDSSLAYNASTTLTIDTGTAEAGTYEIIVTGEGPV